MCVCNHVQTFISGLPEPQNQRESQRERGTEREREGYRDRDTDRDKNRETEGAKKHPKPKHVIATQ